MSLIQKGPSSHKFMVDSERRKDADDHEREAPNTITQNRRAYHGSHHAHAILLDEFPEVCNLIVGEAVRFTDAILCADQTTGGEWHTCGGWWWWWRR